MNRPASQFVANQICSSLVTKGLVSWTHITPLTFDALGLILPKESIEYRSEYAEEISAHVAEHLRERIANARADGHIVGVEISEDSFARASRADLATTSNAMLALTPSEFEELCASILRALGGTAMVSGSSGDGGIDFSCFDLNFWPQNFPAPPSLNVVVIGQAKRYSTGMISTTKLREFAGAASLRQHEMQASGKFSARQPIIYAFWTTASFEESARNFARRLGIWILDGITMATYASSLGLFDSKDAPKK